MRLHLVWPGKTRDPHYAALLENYLTRIARFTAYEVGELKEPARVEDTGRLVAREGEKILAAVARDDYVVLLDERGRQFSSPALAEFLGARQQASVKRLAFIVGGFAGVSEPVKARTQLIWSLSALTFPHELARVMVAEQLYRAFTLLAGLPYHKP